MIVMIIYDSDNDNDNDVMIMALVVVVQLFACFRRGYGRFRQHVCQRLHRDQRLEDGEYL